MSLAKAIASEAINRKNEYINPVIRITVAAHGMLFLLPRPQCCMFEKGKTDLLMESYLLYGETLEQGIKRVLLNTLPTAFIAGSPLLTLCIILKMKRPIA